MRESMGFLDLLSIIMLKQSTFQQLGLEINSSLIWEPAKDLHSIFLSTIYFLLALNALIAQGILSLTKILVFLIVHLEHRLPLKKHVFHVEMGITMTEILV